MKIKYILLLKKVLNLIHKYKLKNNSKKQIMIKKCLMKISKIIIITIYKINKIKNKKQSKVIKFKMLKLKVSK